MIAPVPNYFPGGDLDLGGRHANSLSTGECIGYVLIRNSVCSIRISKLPPSPTLSLSFSLILSLLHLSPNPTSPFMMDRYISEVSLKGWVGGMSMTNINFNRRCFSCKFCDVDDTLLLTVSVLRKNSNYRTFVSPNWNSIYDLFSTILVKNNLDSFFLDIAKNHGKYNIPGLTECK